MKNVILFAIWSPTKLYFLGIISSNITKKAPHFIYINIVKTYVKIRFISILLLKYIAFSSFIKYIVIAMNKLNKFMLKALYFLKIAFVRKLLNISISPKTMLLIRKSFGLFYDSIF